MTWETVRVRPCIWQEPSIQGRMHARISFWAMKKSEVVEVSAVVLRCSVMTKSIYANLMNPDVDLGFLS